MHKKEYFKIRTIIVDVNSNLALNYCQIDMANNQSLYKGNYVTIYISKWIRLM